MLEEGRGGNPFRHQVRKLGTNALKSLTCDLRMSVEGIRLKEEFASRVRGKIEVQEFVPQLRSVVQRGGVIAQEIGLPSSGVRDGRLYSVAGGRAS